jgi:cell division protein FtsA
VHTSVIPIGGLNLTNDIAAGLRTPMAEAERIKIKYGCAMPTMVHPEDSIEVPSVGGRPARSLQRDMLANIIGPRVEEIFSAVQHVLSETGYIDMLHAGAVLTGGSTLLDGMAELGEEVLGMPVRRAAPSGVGGLSDVVKSPAYATAVGLVKYGAERLRLLQAEQERRPASAPRTKIRSRIGEWFREVF